MPEHVEGTEREPWGRAYSRWFVEQYGDRTATPEEIAVFKCAKGYIDSLLTEREELREALELVYEDRQSNATIREAVRAALARSVLSSRERWDNSDERTGRNTDSPTCPTCASDDPNVRGTWYAIPNSCADPFHATTEGTSE